ncbi:MAG: acetyl-CoA carboxylase, carboxyltransferase subunit beta [Planctomycetota bacterium]
MAETPAPSPTPSPAAASTGAPRPPRTLQPGSKRPDMPAGLWTRCQNCEAMLYTKALRENLGVCPHCDHHHRVGADQRIEQLVDPGSFEAMWTDLSPIDSLSFVDRLPYQQRIDREQGKTGHKDALVAGKAFIKGRRVVMAVMNPEFMMASMGSVVGEKITRAIELATDEDAAFIIVCAGGGARMQESTLAVSQMIKTSAALARFDDAGGLYLALLTDPTTGGTAASFAMLGDITLAEPKALIGFTGARVIANTVRQELPEGFQRSEFLVEKGFVDRVVHRHQLRNEIARLIDYAGK